MSGPGSDGISKVEMAKEAAHLSLEELEPSDLAGVVAFDASNWWLAPMGEIGNAAHLKEMQQSIGRLISNGGTDIYPALVTGYQGLANTAAPRRHMVLLTDGISTDGNYLRLLSDLNGEGITLSTIGVGLDVDAGLLRWLAEEGGGRFYSTDRARDIPTILINETRLAARNAIIEEPTTTLVVGNSPVLRSTGGEFPTLDGYVTTLPKNTGHVVLVSHRGDPLLAPVAVRSGADHSLDQRQRGPVDGNPQCVEEGTRLLVGVGGLDPPPGGCGVPDGGRGEGRCGFVTCRRRSTRGRTAFGAHRRATVRGDGGPLGGHGAGTFRSRISSQRARLVPNTDRRRDV